MENALEAVREFTNESNISRNGKLNSSTMKEMWDYENGMMGPEKRKRDSTSTKRNQPGHNHVNL